MKLFLIVLLFSTNLFAQDKFIMGYIDVFPLSFEKNNEVVGSSINYFKNYLAPKMKIKEIKWVRASMPRLLELLKEKKIHAILTMNKAKEREAFGAFPQNAYSSVQSAIVVNKSFKISSKNASVEDFVGLHLLKTAATHVHKKFKEHSIKFESIYGNDTWSRMFKLLLLGRCDGIYLPMKEIGLHWLEKESGKIKLIELSETRLPMYIMFAKNSPYISIYDKAVNSLPKNLHGELTSKIVSQ